MSIDHRRLDILVPQQSLSDSDIVTAFEQMRRVGMAAVLACRLIHQFRMYHYHRIDF